MSALPEGWQLTRLGDVFEIVGGSTPKTSTEEFWDGDIPWITPDDMSRHSGKTIRSGRRFLTQVGYDSASVRMLPPGSVLYSSRAPIGYTAIVSRSVCTNQGFKSLVVPNGVDSEYVYWYMKHVTPEVQNRASGTTFKEISGKGMKEVPFLLPPLLEQRRIVAAIEEHFSRLDAAEASLSGVRRRLALLANAPPAMSADDFPAAEQERERILLGRRKRFEAAEDEKMSAHSGARRASYTDPLPLPPGLPDPPEGTVWMSLDELCHFTVDYRGKTPPRSETGIPVISAANVRHGRVLIDTSRCVSPEVYSGWISRGVPRKGDLILTTEAPVAEMALFPDGGPYLPTRRVIVAKTGLADNRYLLKALEHPVAQEHLRRHIRGTTVPRILKPALLSTPVPVAAAHAQSDYVERIEHQTLIADRVTAACSASERRSRNLRRSILAAAFSGKLVPQDSSDEPVSVLLERIAAERAATKLSRRKKAAS